MISDILLPLRQRKLPVVYRDCPLWTLEWLLVSPFLEKCWDRAFSLTWNQQSCCYEKFKEGKGEIFNQEGGSQIRSLTSSFFLVVGREDLSQWPRVVPIQAKWQEKQSPGGKERRGRELPQLAIGWVKEKNYKMPDAMREGTPEFILTILLKQQFLWETKRGTQQWLIKIHTPPWQLL